jgi:hypothetical protein
MVHTNPKILNLSTLLKTDVDTIVGKIERIWAWAKIDGNESGEITHIPPAELARIANWNKKATVFMAALIECGFIDNIDGRLFIHEWYKINGKLIEKQRKDRERKNAGCSTEFSRNIHGNSSDSPKNFQGKSAPTLPYHTNSSSCCSYNARARAREGRTTKRPGASHDLLRGADR